MNSRKKTLDLDKMSSHMMKLSFKVFLITLTILIFYFGMNRAFHVGYQIFDDKPVSTEEGRNITIVIDENESTFQIARELEKQGIIHDGYAFIFQKSFFEYKINPGTYTFNTSMTVRRILDIMSKSSKEDV